MLGQQSSSSTLLGAFSLVDHLALIICFSRHHDSKMKGVRSRGRLIRWMRRKGWQDCNANAAKLAHFFKMLTVIVPEDESLLS